MKAKKQQNPTVLRHTVEVSFAEAEANHQWQVLVPRFANWSLDSEQHNTSSEYLCRCNQRLSELKPQIEMLAPSSVMTSPRGTHDNEEKHTILVQEPLFQSLHHHFNKLHCDSSQSLQSSLAYISAEGRDQCSILFWKITFKKGRTVPPHTAQVTPMQISDGWK